MWDLEAHREMGRLDPIEGKRRFGTWTSDGSTLAEFDGNVIILRRDAGDWYRAWLDDTFREELFGKWERSIGMRVDMETGEVVRLPTPGAFYANDSLHAHRCR